MGLVAAVVVAASLWHVGGRRVCEAMFSRFDSSTGVCTGGKRAAEGHRVQPHEQAAGALDALGDAWSIAIVLALVASQIAVAYYVVQTRKKGEM